MRLALALVLAVGCSGTDDTAVPDDATSDDAAVDAATDTLASDTGGSIDAPAETSDAPADAPPACKAKLCDGFEEPADGAPPNPKIWTKAVAGSGTIAVTSEMAHGGKQSLKVVAPSGSYETFVKESVTFPATDNSFWGRVWFRFEEAMPNDFVHWTLFEARGTTSNNRVRYGGINNPHSGSFFTDAFLFNVETQGMGEKGIDDDPTPIIPEKTWICVEWHYVGKSGANEAHLYWNGVERTKVAADTAWFETKFVMPEMDSLYLGWAIYQTISKPYVVHIDDVAIGDTRIGCE